MTLVPIDVSSIFYDVRRRLRYITSTGDAIVDIFTSHLRGYSSRRFRFFSGSSARAIGIYLTLIGDSELSTRGFKGSACKAIPTEQEGLECKHENVL